MYHIGCGPWGETFWLCIFPFSVSCTLIPFINSFIMHQIACKKKFKFFLHICMIYRHVRTQYSVEPGQPPGSTHYCVLTCIYVFKTRNVWNGLLWEKNHGCKGKTFPKNFITYIYFQVFNRKTLSKKFTAYCSAYCFVFFLLFKKKL